MEQNKGKWNEEQTSQATVRKIVKTAFLVLAWICLGLYVEIIGPTLIDLKTRTNSSYESLAAAVSGTSVGYFIGAVIGGFLIDKFGLFLDLTVAVGLDLGAVGTVAIPWVPNTQLIWLLCCLQGTSTGIVNTAGQKQIYNLWQERSAPPMHILHGGYGVGSFLIPLIANPFLAVPKMTEYNSTGHNDSITVGGVHEITEVNTSRPENTENFKVSKIEYAYMIPSLITAGMSIVFYYYQFCDNLTRNAPKRQGQLANAKTASRHSMKLKEIINPASCTNGRFFYGLQIFTLLFFFYFTCTGGERISGTFIRAFAIDYYDFSVDDGSYINTTFWISFSVGRFAGFFIAGWVSIRILICIEAGGVLLSTICMVLFSGGTSMALWILILPLGFFIGPLYPSGMGWANYHVQMTGFGITILTIGESIGTLTYLKLLGYLYDNYGPKTYLYTLVGYGGALVLVVVLLNVTGYRHGGRFIKSSVEKEEPASDKFMSENTVESAL